MNIQNYSISLLTSFEKNKNTSAVARESCESQSTASRFLEKLNLSASNFMSNVANLFGKKPLICAIDDFVISRRYANVTEGISSMKDQSTKTFTNGISIVAAGLVYGKYFLPIDLEQWIAEFIIGSSYLKKHELALKIISRLIELKINIKCFVLDGLYFSKIFMKSLCIMQQKFVIKAKTTTSVVYKGKKMQLQNCPDLRLNTNQYQKKIYAEWSGQMWHFIAIRRTGKHGEKIIYLAANFEAKSKIYRKIYDSRWPVEKFIRTGKQSMGLKDSCSQIARIYLNHIKCVFFAYAISQIVMKKFRLQSAEEALRKIQSLKTKLKFTEIVEWISLLVNYA